MFGTKARTSGKIFAIADIGSGSAGVVILEIGPSPRVLALAREDIPLEERADAALKSAVIQALSAAGEKALTQMSTGGKANVAGCYCIIGAPWSKSVAGTASQHFDKPTLVTDAVIGDLAKQALAEQKDIDRTNLLEATVIRVLLNGYPTGEPKGKKASELSIFTLASDCDGAIKSGAQETLLKLFPGSQPIMRSGVRAVLSVSNDARADRLIIETTTEASDLIVVRKGVFSGRVTIPLGTRQLAENFSKGKPAEETLALLDMLEKGQCEDESCEHLKDSIAHAEPDLAKQFGDALAKLSAERKLPNEIIAVAPSTLSGWLSQFLSRIDFTQFTSTAQPFSVSMLAPQAPMGILRDERLATDAGLSIACALVNSEVCS